MITKRYKAFPNGSLSFQQMSSEGRWRLLDGAGILDPAVVLQLELWEQTMGLRFMDPIALHAICSSHMFLLPGLTEHHLTGLVGVEENSCLTP